MASVSERGNRFRKRSAGPRPAAGRAVRMSRKSVIMILGAGGQVGTELRRSFADAGEVTAFDRNAADLSRPEELRSLIRQFRPDVILNAAAYTAVDRAESEPGLAMTINGE